MASRHFDHFGNPMAAAIIGFRPFEAKDAALRRAMNSLGDLPQAFARQSDKSICFRKTSGKSSQFAQVLEDIGHAVWRKPNDLRLVRQGLERARYFVSRRSADMAKGLGEDVSGRELLQQSFIHDIEALPAANTFAHRRVDFAGGHSLQVEGVSNHDRFVPGGGGEIALVGNAHQLVAQAQRKHHFRGRGKKGDDPKVVHFAGGGQDYGINGMGNRF